MQSQHNRSVINTHHHAHHVSAIYDEWQPHIDLRSAITLFCAPLVCLLSPTESISCRLWSLLHFSELQASRRAAVGQYAAAAVRNVPVMLSHFPGCLLTSYMTESRPAPLISCWDSQQGMMGGIPTQCSCFTLLSFPISLFVSQFVLESVFSLLFFLPTYTAYIL